MKRQGGIMSGTKERLFITLICVALALFWVPLSAESQHGHDSKSASNAPAPSGAEQKPTYASMPGPGKKVPIGDNYYFIYSFDKPLKLGTVIMKVEVFTKDGKKETSMEVKADSGMPSMKGHHETGDRLFKLSKTGNYLLPIDLVMRGDWEIKVTLLKDGKVIFRGSYQFDV